MESRITKQGLDDSRELEWLQGGLKEMTREAFEKLKTSLRQNGFVMAFHVWEDGKTWILDGHHRKKALESLASEGLTIPDELPANFVQCKNLAEAKRLVLVYSSIYAHATEDTLYEYLHTSEIDFDALKMQIDLPQIDLVDFKNRYFDSSILTMKETEAAVATEELNCPKCGFSWRR